MEKRGCVEGGGCGCGGRKGCVVGEVHMVCTLPVGFTAGDILILKK